MKSRRDGKRVLVGIEHGASGIADLVQWLAPAGGAPRTAASRPAKPGRAARTPARERRAASPPAKPEEARTPVAGTAAEPRTEDRSHAEAPASGTHALPYEAPPSRPRRLPDTIEDFLL